MSTEGLLSENASRELLRTRGIIFNSVRLAHDETELLEILAASEYPLVLKVASPAITHKSDIGGVETGLATEQATIEAFHRILRKARSAVDPALVEGVSVQSMISGGVEIALGAKRSPNFGPVLLVGAGGVLIELIRDVALRVCPIGRDDVHSMLNELRTSALLTGYRGRALGDVEALVDMAVALSEAMLADTTILEVDLNPVMVLDVGRGAVAVDALVRVADCEANT